MYKRLIPRPDLCSATSARVRSCTLAIAWLMLTEGVDYDEAYLRVRHGRPICAPNTGFICSLLEWQRRRQQVRISCMCGSKTFRTKHAA